MGRWKLDEHVQRQLMTTVALERRGTEWRMRRAKGVALSGEGLRVDQAHGQAAGGVAGATAGVVG